MPYQYKREPLTADEATRLANACAKTEEKLVVWTLLDTGLRLNELANLKIAHARRDAVVELLREAVPDQARLSILSHEWASSSPSRSNSSWVS